MDTTKSRNFHTIRHLFNNVVDFRIGVMNCLFGYEIRKCMYAFGLTASARETFMCRDIIRDIFPDPGTVDILLPNNYSITFLGRDLDLLKLRVTDPILYETLYGAKYEIHIFIVVQNMETLDPYYFDIPNTVLNFDLDTARSVSTCQPEFSPSRPAMRPWTCPRFDPAWVTFEGVMDPTIKARVFYAQHCDVHPVLIVMDHGDCAKAFAEYETYSMSFCFDRSTRPLQVSELSHHSTWTSSGQHFRTINLTIYVEQVHRMCLDKTRPDSTYFKAPLLAHTHKPD